MPADPPDWSLVKRIVAEAMDAPRAARRALIVSRTGSDLALRAEVESLVSAAETTDSLLTPALDTWVGATGQDIAALLGERVGQYTLERLIAEGASSAVYVARQEAPRRVVAVKLLRDRSPLLDAPGRFAREAVALGRLEHPYVARIYEAGLYQPPVGRAVPFLAMEFVDGPAITEFARQRALARDEIIDLMVKVAGAVQAAHQQAIIHRDLKPANVLIGADGAPKVLDFGIARLLDHDAAPTWCTSPGLLLGTPGYMSPEQAQGNSGEDIDVRTDVWALGVLLYELLSGSLPIPVSGLPVHEVLRRMAQEEPVQISRVKPELRGDVEVVVMKALQREKSARYDSAQALLDDLNRLRRHEPIHARRPTRRYRMAKFARRHRAGLALALLFAFVVCGAASLLAKSYVQLRRERDRARAVSRLLSDLVAAGDPAYGDRNARLIDVLRHVEERISARVGTSPEVEADVRSALGSMYFGLGDYEKSHALLVRAIELRDSQRDGGDVALLEDRNKLATTLRWEGKHAEALAIAQKCLSQARDELGSEHVVTLAAMEIIAGCSHDVQELAAAESQYREVLDACRRVLGENAEQTLTSMVNLANVLSDAGKYAEAEKLQRTALELRHGNGEKDTLSELTVRHNLAITILELGRLDEALPILESVVGDAEIALGPQHEQALGFESSLAEALRRKGRTDQALALERGIFERRVAAFGWNHESTHNQCNAYLAALLRDGRYSDAHALAERAVVEAERAFGRNDILYHRQRLHLAAALSGLRQFEKAQELYRASLAFFNQRFGADHRLSITASNNLGLCFVESGNGPAAVAVLEPALARVRANGLLPMEPTVRRNLGNAYRLCRRFEDAKVQLLEAWNQSTARGEVESAGKAADSAAQLFRDLGDEAQAGEWQARALAGDRR